jgi:hypothetical protein
MKQRTIKLVAALAVVAGVLTSTPANAATDYGRTRSDVVFFADPDSPVGTSTLVRTPHGVSATFRTSGLMPREALTLWWVVFNAPDGCSDACGEDDIFIDGDPTKGINFEGVEAADIVVGYASGTVASRVGRATMTARLRTAAEVSEVLFGETPLLKSSTAAEIHLVARSHGPALEGLVDEQIGSYAGGCEVFLHPPEVPSAEGECADIQFSVHLP